jgi:hypothetical protein
MAGEFENVPFHCSRYYDIVNQASTGQPAPLLTENLNTGRRNKPQMNDMLTQTHTPGMRADRDAELGGHQQNGENLTHTSEADGVYLADVDGFRLEKLLEDHPVMRVFTSGDANAVRFESLPNGSVAENIIRGGRLLDEPSIRRSEQFSVK